jgi:hypothetical protein
MRLIFAILTPIAVLLLHSHPIAAQDIDERSAARDKAEVGVLSTSPTVARRDKDALFITLENGAEVAYKDNACAAYDIDCLHYKVDAYDPQRRILVLEIWYHEDQDYELVSLQSGDSIVVSGSLQSAPEGRFYWAAVDDGEHGSGDMTIVTLENGKFRILGQVNHPLCRFERWNGEFAFLVICWGTDKDRGEFRVSLGSGAMLQVSRTARRLTEEEILGVEP